MDHDHLAGVQAIAALEEPTRRQLYELVTRSPSPVSKDEAAAALAIPRTTAAFHLDKLVDGGLLSVVYERRCGRSGPGAGRPAKLYRRSDLQVEISLPERTYDTAGLLLAAALEEAEATGESPAQALARHATRHGRSLGRAARAPHSAGEGTRKEEPGEGEGEAEPGEGGDSEAVVLGVLARQGFEPWMDEADILLGNCPFHVLAKEHTKLVCGMNRRLLEGVLEGLGDDEREAVISPGPGHCCVRINRKAS